MFDSAPGDRSLPINAAFPENAFYHADENCCVLNVKAPPFNAKGDGVTDDTQALCSALRFIRDHLEIITDKNGGRQCGQRLTKNWLIYLPDGEYLVSDTLSQGFPPLAMNILDGWSKVNFFSVKSPEHEEELYRSGGVSQPYLHANPSLTAYDDNHGNYMRGQYSTAKVYAECNWAIRIMGQSRQNTVIRLKDASPGFERGNEKPVLTYYLLQRGSNINTGIHLRSNGLQVTATSPHRADQGAAHEKIQLHS